MEEQFNLFEGRKLRDQGMELAADVKRQTLHFAKRTARNIAEANHSRECTIDDVQRVLIAADMHLGMAAGSVFKGDEWIFTGRYLQTERKSSHARQVKVWRLR